jgi:hypothetical protein
MRLVYFLLVTWVVGTNGVIAPPENATSVNIVFTVTRTSDSSTENTGIFNVMIPAHIKTAAEVAAGVASVTAPVINETSLTLPNVPSGYEISIFSSSNTGVIGTNGVIVPPLATININLVFTIKRTSDSTTAMTSLIVVTVPVTSISIKKKRTVYIILPLLNRWLLYWGPIVERSKGEVHVYNAKIMWKLFLVLAFITGLLPLQPERSSRIIP